MATLDDDDNTLDLLEIAQDPRVVDDWDDEAARIFRAAWDGAGRGRSGIVDVSSEHDAESEDIDR